MGDVEDRILASLARNAPDGIVLVDAKGHIVWVNARAGAMARSNVGALAGMAFDALVHESSDGARELRRADGTRLPVELALTVLRDREPPLVAATIRDASDRVDLARELRESREEVRRAITLVAGVAHELATPLNVLEMAQDDGSTASDDAARERARTGARVAMTQMKHLLVELRRATNDEAPVLRNVALLGVVQAAEHLAAPAIERAHARVTHELEGDCAVVGEPGRLVQVLANLLTNAAHAVDGRDERTVAVRATTRAPWVSIEVEDSGVGIATGDLDRVFDPYFSTKPRSLGTGLGLSICRSIVHTLGGRIEVESDVGVGTRFLVKLRAAS
jgi:signal transduction histidine kinase